MTSARSRARWTRLLAVSMALALVAAACGGGDDSGPSDGAADVGGADDSTDTSGDDASSTDDGGSDEAAADEPASDESDSGDEETVTEPEPAGEPVYGGEISFLTEAETQTWDLPNAECAQSCINVFRLVADALWAVDDGGDPQPFLLESASANADFTEWTMTLRSGISFHDGTPVNAEALKRDLDEKATRSLLHSQVLIDLAETTIADDMTVVASFVAPFSDFPAIMSDRVGFLMAPAFWDMSGAERGLSGPIGTGAFFFSDWSPDERLLLERNPEYWRTDSEGRQLPYLDRVIIRPVPNTTDREAIIQAGDGSLTHLSNTENPNQWLEGWDGDLIKDLLGQEVSYLQFNNSVPPFDDIRARQAIAYCSDLETFNTLRNPASRTANGPFAPGAPGFLEDTGIPTFDPDAGAALVDDLGGLSVNYLTTDDVGNLLNAQVFADQWDSNCGIDVSIDQIDQGELISTMLSGSFDLIQTRNHGSVVPSMEYIWWHSRHAAPPLPLNFSRFSDPSLDSALETMRATADPAERSAAAEEINRIFGEQVYNVWYAWTEWWIVNQPDVEGVGVLSLPDGGFGNPHRTGNIWVTEAWLS